MQFFKLFMVGYLVTINSNWSANQYSQGSDKTSRFVCTEFRKR